MSAIHIENHRLRIKSVNFQADNAVRSGANKEGALIYQPGEVNLTPVSAGTSNARDINEHAIIRSLKLGRLKGYHIQGAIIYLNSNPCDICKKAIACAGIKTIITEDIEIEPNNLDGITIIKLTDFSKNHVFDI
jgi:deoxycytidylate deaminase